MVIIRNVTTDDLVVLLKLEQDEFGDHGLNAVTMRQQIDLFSDIFFVAENENEVVGFAIGGVSIKNRKGWLLDVVVREDFRKKGIGTKLVTTSIISTAKYCKRKVALTVEPNNPAITLYKRLGFVDVGVEQNYFGVDALRILMEADTEGFK